MQLTDDLLRSEIEKGLKPAQIARKYGISRQAVSERVKKITLTTTTLTTIAPDESRRYVNQQLDAMEELGLCVRRVKLLQDACDEWLRDAKDRDKYDVGPRGNEVMVTYWEQDEEKPRKAKAPLSWLLQQVDGKFDTIKAETRYSDPRQMILSTAAEVRQTVALCVQLAQMLADAKAMQAFREAMLDAISQESPEVAQKIASRLRSVLILHGAAGGSPPIPS